VAEEEPGAEERFQMREFSKWQFAYSSFHRTTG
jgi:hypothetical protein